MLLEHQRVREAQIKYLPGLFRGLCCFTRMSKEGQGGLEPVPQRGPDVLHSPGRIFLWEVLTHTQALPFTSAHKA